MQLIDRFQKRFHAVVADLRRCPAGPQPADQRRHHFRQTRLLRRAFLRGDAPQQIIERLHRRVPIVALSPVLQAQRGQVVRPGGFAERAHVERQSASRQLVADERAHVRAVRFALLGRKRGRDFLIERGGDLALLGVDEFLQLRVGFVEHRDIDIEVVADLVDNSGGHELESGPVSRIAHGADSRQGQVIEQASRRVFPVRKEAAVDQRRLQNRNLQATEKAAQRFGNRRIAKDVVEQEPDDIDRDLVGRIDDLVGNRRANVRDAVERQEREPGPGRGLAVGRNLSTRIDALPAIQERHRRRKRPECHHRIELRQAHRANDGRSREYRADQIQRVRIR